MLIREKQHITIDVNYVMWEELPRQEGHKRCFPFHLLFTVQINGGIKRVNVKFDVYDFKQGELKPYDKFDLYAVHSVVDIFRELWYDIDYPVVVEWVNSYVSYMVKEILKRS